MDIFNNLYGHIEDMSTVLLGVGNYNSIHGLSCFYPQDNCLEFRPISEIVPPLILEAVLRYKKTKPTHFYLEVKNYSDDVSTKYISVDIIIQDGREVALAVVSHTKTYFTIDYSIVDTKPRPLLLAGTLYSLQTTVKNKNYIVSWKIKGFSYGDLIVFLPTTWYQKNNLDDCQFNTGSELLVENLNLFNFKGFTNKYWCESFPFVTNCDSNTLCGQCMGRCKNPNQICWPSDNTYICGDPVLVSFATETVEAPNNNQLWILLTLLFLFICFLFFIAFKIF